MYWNFSSFRNFQNRDFFVYTFKKKKYPLPSMHNQFWQEQNMPSIMHAASRVQYIAATLTTTVSVFVLRCLLCTAHRHNWPFAWMQCTKYQAQGHEIQNPCQQFLFHIFTFLPCLLILSKFHHHHHHHHHHVPEGLGMLACSFILKMKLVPPSVPQSSYVSSSVWFIL